MLHREEGLQSLADLQKDMTVLALRRMDFPTLTWRGRTFLVEGTECQQEGRPESDRIVDNAEFTCSVLQHCNSQIF